MMFYAQPRMTRDLDFVIAIVPAQVTTLVNSFSAEYYISQDAVQSLVQHKSMFNAIQLATIIKVDFIVRKDSSYRRAEFDRRKQVTIRDSTFWITSKEDLINLKAQLGEGFGVRTANSRHSQF